MNVSALLKGAQRFTADNSPTILSVVAVAGVAGTAYAASKATAKAVRILQKDNDNRDRDALHDTEVFPRTKKETFKLLWKLYIPAVTTGVLTITAIVAANRISTGRAAALAAAYAVNQQGWEEYEKKVKDMLGEKKDAEIKTAVAQDKIDGAVGSIDDLILLDDSEQLFLDGWSRRPFKSTRGKLEQMQNTLNHSMIHGDTVSLSELYGFLELSSTDISGEIGWNADALIDLTFVPGVVSEGKYAGRTCFVMGSRTMPFREYRSLH